MSVHESKYKIVRFDEVGHTQRFRYKKNSWLKMSQFQAWGFGQGTQLIPTTAFVGIEKDKILD